MFTGLVEALAKVTEISDEPPGKRFRLRMGPLAESLVLGESIAINGCCLTAVACCKEYVEFEAGPETLSRTNLGGLAVGSQVNIERSLKVGDRLGGHFVTGHIDGIAAVDERHDHGSWSTFWFRAPDGLTGQMVPKGSIAVDGVSLTLIEVSGDRFSVQLIPHTLAVTTLGKRQPGDRVNLETDLLAKYVQKQLAAGA